MLINMNKLIIKMNVADETMDALQRAHDTLPEDQRDKPWGQLLLNLSPYLICYGKKLQDFILTSQRIEVLDRLSTQLADDLNHNRDLLMRVLNTQKNQCSWYSKWWDDPIDNIINNVEQLSEDAVKDMIKKITNQVEEAKIVAARDALKTSTTAIGLTTVFSTLQVISTYMELKEASNLVEASRKKLASGGIVAMYIEETLEHVTKASTFLAEGLLDEAMFRLNRAGASSQLAYTELNGIQIRCEGQIKTLKTGQVMSVGSSISTCLMTLLHVSTIVSNPTAGIGTALRVAAWSFAGAGFFLSGLSAGAYFIASNRINELQSVLEEIEKKMVEWNRLRAQMNELSNLIESKRLEARRQIQLN